MMVRILAEWHSWPTWVLDSDGELDDVPPESLALSEGLVADLLAWSGEFQATYDEENPASSGFDDPALERSWIERGKALSKRVAAELRNVPVEFQHHGVTYPA